MDQTAHPLMCCHKSQPQQAEIAQQVSLPRPPQGMLMLLKDTRQQWSCHQGQQGLNGNTRWYMQLRSPAPAKLVAGLALHLSFQEQWQCSSTICNDDGNATAIPSHPSRIGQHILWLGAVLIKKYSSYHTNQKNPARVFSICFLPTKYSNKSLR